jgi:hypothetical protein
VERTGVVPVIVIVPRYVRASDARYARAAVEGAGYSCRIGPSPLAGYVIAEFAVALAREEPPVTEAFEIEVDNLLRQSWAPFGRGTARLVKFAGSGARIENR